MTRMSWRIRAVGRWVALLVAVPAVLLLGAVPASAHTELELSTPVAGAVLDAPPTMVRLVFNEPISTRLASVVVSGPDGTNHAQGVADGDRGRSSCSGSGRCRSRAATRSATASCPTTSTR